VRLDGIGDALACTPLIVALRAAGHTIGAALSERNADLFAAQTFVARHVLERIPWPAHGSTRGSSERARSEIARENYDIALIASEEPEAFRLATGIRARIGFVNGFAKPLKSLWARTQVTRAVFRPAALRPGGEHEVEILFRLGEGLAAGASPARDPIVLRREIQGPAPVPARAGLVMQLGTKWELLGASRETTYAIAADLARGGGRLIVSPAEVAAVRAFSGATLADWKGEIDRSALLVSPDTGAVHLAGMLGVPVVSFLRWDKAVEAQMARWNAWASASRFLRSDLAPDVAVASVRQAIEALGV